MTVPTVSVVMPVFNGEQFVAEAVQSILQQTFGDFEFIVVDDGSGDRTPEILAGLAKGDSRIVVIRQPRNMGVTEALNTGCRTARGALIARMDADDVSVPERFETQVAYLRQHPEVGVVGSQVRLIDQTGQPGRLKNYPSQPGLVAWSLLFFNSLAHPTVMFRRELLERAGYYPVEWNRVEDYALFLQLSRMTKLANLPDVLLFYRAWEGNVSARAAQEQDRNANEALRRAVATSLGRELTAEQAAALRGLPTDRYPQTVEEIRALGDVIRDLQRRFVALGNLDVKDIEAITRDAAVRLWLLAGLAARKSPLAALTLAASATRTRPSAVVDFARKVIRRLRST